MEMLPTCNIFDENINKIGNKICIPDKGVDYKNILQDTENKDIFYVMYFVPNDTNILRLSRIKKNNNTYSVLKTATYAPPTTPSDYSYNNIGSMYKFLGQTKDYILLSESHYAYANNVTDLRNIIVRRVSKSNLNSVCVIDYANGTFASNANANTTCFGCSHYLIKNDDSYAYLYIYYGETAYIRKYNIVNNTWTNLHIFESNYINNNSIGVSNIIEFNNKYYIITGDKEHTSYELQEITIDENDKVTIKHYPINHSLFPYSYCGFRTNAGVRVIQPYLVYTLKNIENNYIGLTVHHNEGCGAITANNKHILIKKTIDNNFEITDVKSISNCYGVLYYNPYVSVILTNSGYTFYKLNTDTDTWNKVREEAGSFNYIAFDSYKRFYTVNTNNKVTIYSNITTYEIDVHFENISYQYEKDNITTNCIISAKNFLNEYIETTLKVTLTGPVKFMDNTTEKEIKTINGVLQEPVYIYNSGQIGVHAVEMEG
jgi:hypothetical protein